MTERCDACGTTEVQAARTFHNIRTGQRLTLCGHHARKHELALTAEGWIDPDAPAEQVPTASAEAQLQELLVKNGATLREPEGRD